MNFFPKVSNKDKNRDIVNKIFLNFEKIVNIFYLKNRPLGIPIIKGELMNGLNQVLSYITVNGEKIDDDNFFQLIKFFASSKLGKWRDLTNCINSNSIPNLQTPQNRERIQKNLKSGIVYDNYCSTLIFLDYFFTGDRLAISDKIQFKNVNYYINPQPNPNFKPLKHFAKILHSVCLYIMHIFYFYLLRFLDSLMLIIFQIGIIIYVFFLLYLLI